MNCCARCWPRAREYRSKRRTHRQNRRHPHRRKYRGLSGEAAAGWGLAVLLVLIVFLPLYLWLRSKNLVPLAALSQSPKPVAPIAGVPCPYCGYENAGNSDYCGKCGRQLRSSTEIHR